MQVKINFKSSKPFVFIGLFLLLNVAAIRVEASTGFEVFRPSTSTWYSLSSGTKEPLSAMQWGLATDVLVPADYDGDRKTDIAVWRPESGVWYIRRSSDDSLLIVQWGKATVHPYGVMPDVPVPADYDGDGQADIAVWRPDTGIWYVLNSADNYAQEKAKIFHWGKFGDVPIQADYDGDGQADLAVFRPVENRWYVRQSKTGEWQVQRFGNAGYDLLIPADYTGDGKADIAVYRLGTWFVLDSANNQTEIFQFGFGDDTPVPADYDADGETDFAVFRKGAWYIYESSGPRFRTFHFGLEGDIPLNSLNAKQSIVGAP